MWPAKGRSYWLLLTLLSEAKMLNVCSNGHHLTSQPMRRCQAWRPGEGLTVPRATGRYIGDDGTGSTWELGREYRRCGGPARRYVLPTSRAKESQVGCRYWRAPAGRQWRKVAMERLMQYWGRGGVGWLFETTVGADVAMEVLVLATASISISISSSEIEEACSVDPSVIRSKVGSIRAMRANKMSSSSLAISFATVWWGCCLPNNVPPTPFDFRQMTCCDLGYDC